MNFRHGGKFNYVQTCFLQQWVPKKIKQSMKFLGEKIFNIKYQYPAKLLLLAIEDKRYSHVHKKSKPYYIHFRLRTEWSKFLHYGKAIHV